MLDPRKRRIAENESRFRAINDRLSDDLAKLPVGDELIDFVCECGHAECAAGVPLTLAEYTRVRQDPLLFAMLPGHEIPDAEDVLGGTDRYIVVRKRPEAAPVVEPG